MTGALEGADRRSDRLDRFHRLLEGLAANHRAKALDPVAKRGQRLGLGDHLT